MFGSTLGEKVHQSDCSLFAFFHCRSVMVRRLPVLDRLPNAQADRVVRLDGL